MFVSRTSFLKHLETVDYVKFTRLNFDWDAMLVENETAAREFPQYCQPMVIDQQQYQSWDSLGNDYYDTIRGLRDWGYLPENTRTWETTAAKPQMILSWEQDVMRQLPLQHAVSKGTMQTPGNIMPWHQDKFFTFRRQYPDNPYVIRFIMFLQDWKLGHVLQAGNSIISHWRAGDVLTWHPDRFHLSANIGIENKWTVNVTGVLEDSFYWPYQPDNL